MSKEREQLNKAFNRSRSRLAYVNVSLAAVLVIGAVITIWLIVLDY
jgi:quinol-cytochrome oxidoreductase complex cytochrome b subunit